MLVSGRVRGFFDLFVAPPVLLQVGILYISTELHQIHIMADDMAFLHDGIICELGPAADVLALPKHAATKDYIL